MPGRAELTRLCFKLGGVKFNDKRISFEEWGKIKGDENNKHVTKELFGTLPVIEHRGLKLG